MVYGVSNLGFQIKTFEIIKQELETNLLSSLGNSLDLSSETVIGQLVGLLSLIDSELWQELEDTYLSLDPDYAEGSSLDAIGKLTGTYRKAATNSLVNILCTGTLGTIIPIGSTVRDSIENNTFSTQSAVTIQLASAGRVEIEVLTNTNSVNYVVGVNGTNYIYSNGIGQTSNQILTGISTALNSAPGITKTVVGDVLTITSSNQSINLNLTLDAKLRLKSIGSFVQVKANIAGKKQVALSTLTIIDSPISGWSSVTNLTTGVAGEEPETDAVFRARRKLNVSQTARATVDAIFTSLNTIKEVTRVKVYENSTQTTDGNGTPGNSIWAIVEGATNSEIATVIFNEKPAGIGMRGAVSTSISSGSGQAFNILFDRPVNRNVFIAVTVNDLPGFPGNAVALIKQSLIDYFKTLDIGSTIYYSRLFIPIQSSTGFEITDLRLGFSASPTGVISITPAINELPVLLEANIGVTVV